MRSWRPCSASRPRPSLDGTEQSDTLSWDFDSGAETFDYLANGETLILEYTVKATDDDGTTGQRYRDGYDHDHSARTTPR